MTRPSGRRSSAIGSSTTATSSTCSWCATRSTDRSRIDRSRRSTASTWSWRWARRGPSTTSPRSGRGSGERSRSCARCTNAASRTSACASAARCSRPRSEERSNARLGRSSGGASSARRPPLRWRTARGSTGTAIASPCPPGADALAANEVGVQAFRVGRSVGVQFHPEVDVDLLASWLLDGGPPDPLFAELGVEVDDIMMTTSNLAATSMQNARPTRRLVPVPRARAMTTRPMRIGERKVDSRRRDRGAVALRRPTRRHRAARNRGGSRRRGRGRARATPRGRAPRARASAHPRRRVAPAARTGRAVRADHLGRSREADQDGEDRSDARRRHAGVLGRRRPHGDERGHPARRVGPRRRQARLRAARADRRRRRDLAVQLPAQPRVPQGRPGDRSRLPGRAQARVGHADVGARARRPAPRRMRPARRLAQRRDVSGPRREPPRRAPRRRDDHVHRIRRGGVGHPGACASQEGRPRARQQRAGGDRARRRLAGRSREDQGRGLLARRAVVHLDPACLRARRHRRPLRRRARRRRVLAGGRRPGRRGHRPQRAHRSRARPSASCRGSTTRSRPGAKVACGGDSRWAGCCSRRCSPTSRRT